MKKNWALYLLFTALSAVVVLSNQNDWDHFLSFFEVELRSWLVDHQPPLWTYQLCAGVTRLGDPQAFGLSPLFLPVLLLGSFWGAKALVLGCAFLAVVYLNRIFLLLAPAPVDPRVALSLSAFFLFGNYFVWHLHVGHLTFALVLFSLVPAFYILRGFSRGLNAREGAALVLSAFCYCTAGFYHSAVFFVLPLTGIFFTLLLFLRPKLTAEALKRVAGTSALFALALALSAYKWLSVLRYQDMFPRQLQEILDEATPAGQALARFFLPTLHFRYLGLIEDWGPWAVYEDSVFSFLPWALIALLAAAAISREKVDWRRTWAWPLGFCFFITLLFCVGNVSAFSPVFWLNKFFLSNSLRVVARFQAVLLFLLALFLLRYLALHPRARDFYLKWLMPVGYLVTFLSMLTFVPLLNWDEAQQSSGVAAAEMNRLYPVRSRDTSLVSHSYMYEAVNKNRIVPNCYQPLGRYVRIGHERWRSSVLPVAVEGEIDLLAPGKSGVSEECRQSAFVSQNEVRFSRSACSDDLCFHLNMLNLHRPENLVWNGQRRLYCIK